ncbi:MAG: tripartite tricarboxylate transporter substrate binding protein [Hydrogenophaga sp.]|uniref:Bug family tripartite tricarboxylate transporter substrate binding protein n=1 Tax=Hydrogenophaga sp. TaxID=1904254 RepID=UPI0016B68BF3|nr:tripartite tricarboxylate transporter substrate binding protein [Hydrogenophaga sp.]NIM43222.1 tripartite tricarboxylate transporter substrate binding protein [Hydrogenophaga sp.]NIN28290.1 tripartite tricarboxylate transporter substrate binding protein [Hydrogenophaga sp.]NIN29109.1 tripartite tricarboxylate transporter substrate binding protein [Hydrogenophaga sp.]NIN57425.1 tripartite tricarboxylate transporter substrate binding protein [Hydrogenophaga sp.]NIO53720.1 tripartite tricarbox
MKKMLFALGATMTLTTAMAWPDKTVTIVVPFPPGGSTDMIARTLQPKLQEKFGGTFVIDNKPGATGTIGATLVTRAAPDGHTLFVSSLGPYVIAPHLTKVTYDATKDFDYITVAVQAPNVLVVPAASPHKSMADVMAFQKANPGKMTFASSGNGSSDHLTAELYWQQTGTSGVHVPYKGGGPVMTDLLGNQVDSSFMNINTAMPQIKAGKLRALSITSAQRSALLPDVPTLDELGIKDANVYSWQAVAAPKGIPADLKNKLQAAIKDALNDPSIKPKLLDLGFEIVANSPEEFTKFQAAEFARWQKLITARNIKAD